MRKTPLLLSTFLAAALALTACGSDAPGTTTSPDPQEPATTQEGNGGGEVTSLTVGASPVPHALILEHVRDTLAAEAGIDIEIVEFDDYVTPNTALNDGSIDANYFQHVPYFDAQVEEFGFEFEHGEGIHIEPFAAFSEQHASVEDVPDGGVVAITNDPSNQVRALWVLEAAGLLADIDEDSTVLTLTDEQNPKGLRFEENQPEVIVQLVGDPQVDVAMINGNFILTAGLNTDNAIAVEEVEGNPYANVLAWKTDSDKLDAIATLEDLLHSDEVAEFIQTQWPSGDVIPG